MSVPALENVKVAAESVGRYAELSQRLPESFTGHIRRRQSSAWYNVAIFATALMLILLPLVYVGLTVAVAGGLIFLGIQSWQAMSSLGLFLRLLIYFVPLVSGVVLVLFMLKPLIAPRATKHSKVRLRERDEPLLFAFIGQIAKEVGAPLPKRVDVDVQVNASASFARGWFSLFSNDLVLTIGLPLAASLEIKQFGGVLAHEFGHFSQSVGMRVTFIIREINSWFHRVVFERDRWDVWLDQLRHNETVFVNVIFNISAFGVWCGRRILHGLMVASHAVSCYTLRQMEFDADYYETHLAGSDSFASTCDKLNRLNLARRSSYSELIQSWNQRRVPDNLADYIYDRSQHIPKEILARVREALREAKTGIFDTHPTDRSRIAMAERIGTSGILQMEGRARELFRNFDELARQVTRHHYTIDMELPIEPQHLVPVEEMSALGTRQQQAEESARKFFGYTPRTNVPLYPPAWVWRPPEFLAEGVEELSSLRGPARKAALKMNGLWPEHDRLYERRTQLTEVRSLLEAGFKLQPGTLGIKELSLPFVQEELNTVNAELQKVRDEMNRVQGNVGDRMAAALRCLWTAEVQEGVPDGPALAARTDMYLKCMLALKDTLGPVDELLLMLRRAVVVLENLDSATEPSKAIGQLKNQAPVLIQRLNMCMAGVQDDLKYPFEHSTGEIGCKAYLLGHDLKPNEEMGELAPILLSIGRVQVFFDRLFELQFRLLSEAIMAAVQVEEVTLPDEEPFDADLAGPGNLVFKGDLPVSSSPGVKSAPAKTRESAPSSTGPRAGAILPSPAAVAARQSTEGEAAPKPPDTRSAPMTAKVPLKSTQRMPSLSELGLAPHLAAAEEAEKKGAPLPTADAAAPTPLTPPATPTEPRRTGTFPPPIPVPEPAFAASAPATPVAEPIPVITPPPGVPAPIPITSVAPVTPAGLRPSIHAAPRPTARIPVPTHQSGHIAPDIAVQPAAETLEPALNSNLAPVVPFGGAPLNNPSARKGTKRIPVSSLHAPVPNLAILDKPEFQPQPRITAALNPAPTPPAAVPSPAPAPVVAEAPAPAPTSKLAALNQFKVDAQAGISVPLEKETNYLPDMIMAKPKLGLKRKAQEAAPAPVPRQTTPVPEPIPVLQPPAAAPAATPALAQPAPPPMAMPVVQPPGPAMTPSFPPTAAVAAQPQPIPIPVIQPPAAPSTPSFPAQPMFQAPVVTPATPIPVVPATAPVPEVALPPIPTAQAPAESAPIPPQPLPIQPAPLGKPVVKQTVLPPIPGIASSPAVETVAPAPPPIPEASPPPIPQVVAPPPIPEVAPPPIPQAAPPPIPETSPVAAAAVAPPIQAEAPPPIPENVATRDLDQLDREFAPTALRPTFGPKSTRVIPALSDLMSAPPSPEVEEAVTGRPARRPLLNPEDQERAVMGPRSTRVIPALADLKPGSMEMDQATANAMVSSISLATPDSVNPLARAASKLGAGVPLDRNLREDAPEPKETSRLELPAAAQHLKPIRTEESLSIPLKRGITQRVTLPELPQPKVVKPIRVEEERPTAVRGLKDSGPIIVPELKSSTARLVNRPAPVPPPTPHKSQTQQVRGREQQTTSKINPTERPKPGPIKK